MEPTVSPCLPRDTAAPEQPESLTRTPQTLSSCAAHQRAALPPREKPPTEIRAGSMPGCFTSRSTTQLIPKAQMSRVPHASAGQCICTEPKKLCQWAGILRSIVGLQCTCIEGHGCPARLYDLFSRPVFLLRFLFDINERRPTASSWNILEEIHGLFAPRFRGIGQQFFHLIRPHFRPGRGCLFVIAKEQDCRDFLRSLRTHQHHGEFQTSLLRFQTDIPDLPYGFAFWQILF